MGKFIAKRLLQLIPILFAVSIIAFGLVRVLPGGVAVAFLRAKNITPTAEAVAQAEKTLGLDKSVPEQYLIWVKDAVKLDFGKSYISNKRITPEVFGSFLNTFGLAAMALVWVVLFSFPLGAISSLRPNGRFDHFSRAFAFVGASAPAFFVGFLLVALFSVKMGWFPSYGKKTFASYILPSLTMSFGFIASYSRILRNSLLDNINSTNVLYAKGRGLSGKRVFFAHILRNSLIPVVTNFCLSFGHMLAGSVIVESVFSWPGMGGLIVSSINGRDYPMIQAYVIVMALLFIGLNLLSDILCALINPKIRFEGQAQ